MPPVPLTGLNAVVSFVRVAVVEAITVVAVTGGLVNVKLNCSLLI